MYRILILASLGIVILFSIEQCFKSIKDNSKQNVQIPKDNIKDPYKTKEDIEREKIIDLIETSKNN